MALQTSLTRADIGSPGKVFDPSAVPVAEVFAELTEHRSTFDRRHVLQALAGRAHAGATIGEVEAAADSLLGGPGVVPLGVGRFGLCYSTPELLALEARILDRASTHDKHGVVPDPGETRFAYPGLSGEQVRMVETLTTDGAAITVVVGAAGSGKTRALAAAHDAWVDAGYTVIGCALAARAARQLGEDSEIPSVTVDRLLCDLDRTDTPNLTARTVVVADEAAMIGTRKLARLLDHAHHAGAKVVLVGDPYQLPEIDAGGLFTALADRLGAAHLVGNHRQRDPIERLALAALRAGRVDDAIERLAEHGHIIETPDRHNAFEQIVADWRAATRRGEDAIMLALRRSDVTALNDAARAVLVAEHVVADRTLYAFGRPYAAGDRIITLRNDHRHRLINGQRGTIVHTDGDGFVVQFDGETGPRLVPDAYLEAGHLDHGYAMTVHKAQGITCDRAYVLGSADLYAEAGYTALSRGRRENRLYLTPEDDVDVDHHGAFEDNDPIAGIRIALYRSERQQLATRQLRGLTAGQRPTSPAPQRSQPSVLRNDQQPEHDAGIDP